MVTSLISKELPIKENGNTFSEGNSKEEYRLFFGYKTSFSFQNNPKNLDPSYRTDLDLWDSLGRIKLVL